MSQTTELFSDTWVEQILPKRGLWMSASKAKLAKVEVLKRRQEYRTALVTAAVAGRIDVRPAAKRPKTGGRHEN